MSRSFEEIALEAYTSTQKDFLTAEDEAYYAGQRNLLTKLVRLGVLVYKDDITGFYLGDVFTPIYPEFPSKN